MPCTSRVISAISDFSEVLTLNLCTIYPPPEKLTAQPELNNKSPLPRKAKKPRPRAAGAGLAGGSPDFPDLFKNYLSGYNLIYTGFYNFWGIAPDGSSPKHPFAGITHFKKGFGGKQIDLLRCQDLPLAPKYYINWGVETLRRLKRGF